MKRGERPMSKKKGTGEERKGEESRRRLEPGLNKKKGEVRGVCNSIFLFIVKKKFETIAFFSLKTSII